MTTSTEHSSTDRAEEGLVGVNPLPSRPIVWEAAPTVDAYAENELRRRHERTELMIQKAREQG